MIAKKGRANPSASGLANYLERQDKNEQVIFHGAKGTLSQDIQGALSEMEALKEGTRCHDPLYHVSLRPREGEHLTREQWERAQEIMGEELGFKGHQSIAIEHRNGEDSHYHFVFNRINPETLKAQSIGWNYVSHEKAERRIEKEFELEPVQGRFIAEDGKPRADHGPTQGEVRKAKESGGNVYEWRDEIREIAASLEDGGDLRAALEARGYLLAKGDKVAFMILDAAGNEHRLAQTLGVKVKDLSTKIGGFDPASLPTVEEAREQQKEQEAAREKDSGQDTAKAYAAPSYDRAGMVSQQKAAQRDFTQRTEAQTKAREQQRKAQESEVEAQTKAGHDLAAKKAKDAPPESKEPPKEMTEAQIRQQQKQAAQELFELRYGHGHNERDYNTWERERDRER